MIRIGDSDTELPNNLFDDEFDEDSKVLPTSRPANEATPISYMIAKGRLSFGFGRVLEEINGVSRKGYEEVLKIDKGLRDIYDSIPDYLKLKPMREMSLAPISLIMARFSLATVYHKSQCVLHRRYVRQARPNNRYMYSRRTCIDSAMQLLSFQLTQHQASQERGRLRSVRSHVNSLTTHDFLLAATIICMDLYQQRDKPIGGSGGESGNDVSTPSTSVSGGSISQGSHMSASASGEGPYIPGLQYTRDDLLKALEESRRVWSANRDFSMEAYKASELLNVLLNHLRLPYPTSPPAGGQSAHGAGIRPMQQDGNDEQNAAMTLGMLQSGAGGMNGQQPSVGGQIPMGPPGGPFAGEGKAFQNLFPGAGGPDTPGFSMGNMGSNGQSPLPNLFDGQWAGNGNAMNVDWVSFPMVWED